MNKHYFTPDFKMPENVELNELFFDWQLNEKCTHSEQKFVHPKVMQIIPMLNTLIESQHINSNPDTSLQNTNKDIYL